MWRNILKDKSNTLTPKKLGQIHSELFFSKDNIDAHVKALKEIDNSLDETDIKHAIIAFRMIILDFSGRVHFNSKEKYSAEYIDSLYEMLRKKVSSEQNLNIDKIVEEISEFGQVIRESKEIDDLVVFIGRKFSSILGREKNGTIMFHAMNVFSKGTTTFADLLREAKFKNI